MQIDSGLLGTAMAHERSNDGQVNATIHQVRGETVAQSAGRNIGAQSGANDRVSDDPAYVMGSQSSSLRGSSKKRSALPALQHFVYASSSSVYGGNTKMPFAESDPVDRPVSLYGATKRADELFAAAYAHLFGIPQTGLRFFTVYGPWGRPDMAYFSFARAIMAGRPISLYDAGTLRRDFTYIDDIVAGILGVLDRPPVAIGARLRWRRTGGHQTGDTGPGTPDRGVIDRGATDRGRPTGEDDEPARMRGFRE